MVVKDNAVIAPVSPPIGWGVVRRSRTFADFKSAFIIALIALGLFGIGNIPAVSQIHLPSTTNPVSEAFVALAVVVGIFALIVAWVLSGNAQVEAVAERRKRRLAWEADVLVPYLEQKYGVRFRDGYSLFGYSYPRATIEDEEGYHSTIEVSVHGVALMEGADGETFDYAVTSDIWMEQVIRPEKISYRPLPVVNED